MAAISTVSIALAADSANYQLRQDTDAGATEFDGESGAYQFKAEVGHPGVGDSISTNFIYTHGRMWEEASSVSAVIQWAKPELRVGVAQTNDDARFYLTVYTASTSTVLFEMTATATLSADGSYATQIPFTAVPAGGPYDVRIKTHQHLGFRLLGVTLTGGANTLNFTQADNSAPYGTEILDSGDINGAGTTPATLGDNTVNSVDLTLMIPELDAEDATGNGNRANLNQDPVVNSVDLSMMLDNLDQNGE